MPLVVPGAFGAECVSGRATPRDLDEAFPPGDMNVTADDESDERWPHAFCWRSAA